MDRGLWTTPSRLSSGPRRFPRKRRSGKKRPAGLASRLLAKHGPLTLYLLLNGGLLALGALSLAQGHGSPGEPVAPIVGVESFITAEPPAPQSSGSGVTQGGPRSSAIRPAEAGPTFHRPRGDQHSPT